MYVSVVARGLTKKKRINSLDKAPNSCRLDSKQQIITIINVVA